MRRRVHEVVALMHPVALRTVVTVLNKLTTKGLLSRHVHEGLLHYQGQLTESALMARASRHVVEDILDLSAPPSHRRSSMCWLRRTRHKFMRMAAIRMMAPAGR